MPPIFYDSTLRPFIGATADGTVVLTPAVIGKVSVSKRARNTGKARMIRLDTFMDRGDR